MKSYPGGASEGAADVGPATHALGLPATRSALIRYVGRALALVVAGMAVAVVGGLLLGRAGYPQHENGESTAAGWLSALGFFIAAFGLLGLVASVRMGWCLRRHPWQAWSCRFREARSLPAPNGSPTLVIDVPGGHEQFVLSVVSTVWRWRALEPCDGGEVWLAGDPARGGVVAPPGGTQLLVARRPLSAKRRESLRRHIAESRPTSRP